MNNDLTMVPLVDLIKQATYLDQELNVKINYYNNICEEILRRWPLPELEEVFKTKIITEGEDNKNDIKRMQNIKR